MEGKTFEARKSVMKICANDSLGRGEDIAKKKYQFQTLCGLHGERLHIDMKSDVPKQERCHDYAISSHT